MTDMAMHTEEELREVFNLLDKDGSGSLDREEIVDLASRLGKHLTSDQLDEAMLEMDEDGGGEVDFGEFVEWYRTVGSQQRGVFANGAPKLGQTILRKDMTNAELRTVFLEIDTDGSGVLDRDEVLVLAQRLGHKLTNKQLNNAMSEMDTGGDNEVDFDDFKEWWHKFGSQRKDMFLLQADDRLSKAMEDRAVIKQGDGSPVKFGMSRAAKQKATLRALRASRWLMVGDPYKQDGGDEKEARPPTFAERRVALGSYPDRRIVTGPEGVRLGPSQQLMLDRNQEVADCEYEVAKLAHSHGMNEINGEKQAEEVGHRQDVLDRCQNKLERVFEKEDALAEKWRVNKEDVKLRESLGAGRTMKLLEAEMDELDKEGDNLVQERRMTEKEKTEAVLQRSDAAAAHEALLEAGRELAWQLQAARNTLDEVSRALERKNTIEKGVRDAEGALVEAEDNVEQWKTTRNRAKVETATAVQEREAAAGQVADVQQRMWAKKSQLRTFERKNKALDEQVSQGEKKIEGFEAETEVLKAGELEESDKLTLFKEELAWRERLQGDEQMAINLREDMAESQEVMEKSRRRRTALFEKRKDINRGRTKIEKQRMVIVESRMPHQLEASRLEHQLKQLQQLTVKLGAQYEGARALARQADEELKGGEEHLMECKRDLEHEKRYLEVAERKQQALLRKQAQVRDEASFWRNKFDGEKQAADAEAAAEVAEAARIEAEKALAESRRLRAIEEREAKEAKKAKEAKELAALVAQSQHDAKRWTIGQRVRLKDGQVGTVSNIRIKGATGLGWENRPGITVKLGDPDKFGDHGSVFVGPSEVTPFDYGRTNAAPLKKTVELRLHNGRRPMDGVPAGGVPVPMRAPGATFRRNLSPTKQRMGYTIHAGRRDSTSSADADYSAAAVQAAAFSSLASAFASQRGGVALEQADAGFDGFAGANSSFGQLAGHEQRWQSGGRAALSPLRHSIGGGLRPSSVGAGMGRHSMDGAAGMQRPQSVGGHRRRNVVDRLYPDGLDRSKDMPRIAKYLDSLGDSSVCH